MDIIRDRIVLTNSYSNYNDLRRENLKYLNPKETLSNEIESKKFES
jgi:hypothetical protein